MRNGHGTRSSCGYEDKQLNTLKRANAKRIQRPSMANIVIERSMNRGTAGKTHKTSSDNLHSAATLDQIYEGEWVNDRRTGHGILKVNGVYTYYGQWEDNRRTGYGVVVYEITEGEGKGGGGGRKLEEMKQEGLWNDGKLEQPIKHKLFMKNDLEQKVRDAHAKAIDAARQARQKAHVAEERADTAAAKCQAAKGKAVKAKECAENALLKSDEVVQSTLETIESAKDIKGRVKLMLRDSAKGKVCNSLACTV